MKHVERIPVLLHHLVVACNRIALYVGDRDEELFLADLAAQDAVLRQIEVLGEAAKRIRDEDETFFERSNMAELDQVIGMRNRIAHEYLNVKPAIVWHVAHEETPRLRVAILDLLQSLGFSFDPDSLTF